MHSGSATREFVRVSISPLRTAALVNCQIALRTKRRNFDLRTVYWEAMS